MINHTGIRIVESNFPESDRTQFFRDAEASTRMSKSSVVNDFLDSLCEYRAFIEVRDACHLKAYFWEEVDRRTAELKQYLKSYGYYRNY